MQFAALERLSLSHNLVDDLDELLCLSPLRRLRCLRLDGNPVCYHPAYRHRVLEALLGLVELDGVAVSAADRAASRAVLAHIDAKEALIRADISTLARMQGRDASAHRVLYEKVQ